jgi:beta-glucanase (GH16 family)
MRTTPTRFAGILALVAAGVLAAALGGDPSRASAADPQPNGGPSGDWRLLFDDEFSGSGVDLATWQPNWFGFDDTQITGPVNTSRADSCADPRLARVIDGELRLRVVRRYCQGYRYAGSLISSNPAGGGNFQFTHGYVEFRAVLPAERGIWTALFTNGQNWPADGEIDVLESGIPSETDQGWYYHSSSGVIGDNVTIPGASTRMHTYALLWEPGLLKWYFDGRPVGTVTEGVTSAAHYLVLSASDWSPANPAGPATTRVDYVRVWERDPDAPPPAASARVSGTTLVVTADSAVRDNLRISSPTGSTLRVTNYPSGSYAGSAVEAGAGCTDGGDRVADCDAATIRRIKVLAGDRADKVVNSTRIQSSFYGEGGDDELLGGDSSDTFYGGPGANVLKGRAGQDDLFARNLTSDKLIDCGDNADEADIDKPPYDPGSAVTGCESLTRR